MPQFAVITPTIGREVLKRCLLTMRGQMNQDYLQIVVGDGPQEKWVKEECDREKLVYYMETKIKEGFYGTAPRNTVLQMIDDGLFGDIEYILFVDDDNILLESALYNLSDTIKLQNRPPLIWHEILFTNKYTTDYHILPKSHEPLKQGDWDSLNCIFRADVIRGLRWKAVYNHDFLFSQEATERAKSGWVRCNGVGAVHCLSWDTYELKQP